MIFSFKEYIIVTFDIFDTISPLDLDHLCFPFGLEPLEVFDSWFLLILILGFLYILFLDLTFLQIIPPWAMSVEKDSPMFLGWYHFTFSVILLVEVSEVFLDSLSMAHVHVVISTVHLFLLSGVSLLNFDGFVSCMLLFLF